MDDRLGLYEDGSLRRAKISTVVYKELAAGHYGEGFYDPRNREDRSKLKGG